MGLHNLHNKGGAFLLWASAPRVVESTALLNVISNHVQAILCDPYTV